MGVWRWFRGLRRRWQVAIGIGVLFILIAAVPTSEEPAEDDAEQLVSNATTATATAAKTAAPTRTATQAPTPAPTPSWIGNGDHRVGTDIQPGTYRTVPGSALCYWQRSSGFGGNLSDILANDNVTGASAIVDILPSDVGFTSRGGCRWTPLESAVRSNPSAPFRDGNYAVGLDITPGTWRAAGASGLCYWQRSSGFSGELGAILANSAAEGSAIVQILASDVGFKANGCGEWTLQ